MELPYNRFLKIGYPGFEIGKCLTELINNAQESTINKPAQYIKKAIKAGGLSMTGSPTNPIEYHTKEFFKKINFKLVYTFENSDQLKTYRPLPGDTAIMYTPVGDKGHICMWDGYEWISDFIQKSIRPYSDTGTNPSTIWIYRWDTYGYLEKNNLPIPE